MADRTFPALKILRIALSILAVPLLAWVVFANWDKFAVIADTPVTTFFWIAVVTFVSLVANSLRLKIAAALFGARLTPIEAFSVGSSNAFFNIVTPMKGGIAVKGMYLHEVHEMSWPGYAGSLLFTQLLASTLSMTLALIVLAAFDVVPVGVIAAAGILLAAVAWLAWRKRGWLETRLLRSQYLDGATDRLANIARERPALLLFAAAHAVFLLCITTRLFLVFSVFVPDVEFWQVLLIQSVLTGALFVSLTPGNIGVQEGLVAVAGTFLAIEPASAVLASLSERAFVLLTVLPIGGLCSISVMRRIRDAARP